MSKITWTPERRKLGDLIPWERNPRQIKRDQAKRLEDSFESFGQVETVAIGPGNELYNGHQRLAVLVEKYGPEFEIDARVSSRPLTEKEREKLTAYLHKGAVGGWDWDMLANNFEVDELLEWGFSEEDLSGLDYETTSLTEKKQDIRLREMLRVLVSVPLDKAIDARALVEKLAEIDGAEVVYGSN